MIAERLPRAWTLMVAGLVLAIFASYWNGLAAPFIFDDVPSIADNRTIRSLDNLSAILMPPNDSGVTINGRPLVNLSLALNYAMGGTSVRVYHATNLVIHALATLVLFGLLRRTFQLEKVRLWMGPHATLFAFFLTSFWALHPIQTQSVTYIIQRAESLVGLFYLAMLYALVRSATSGRPGWWLAASVAACICGMATKEVMVSAPLVAFLYCRTFLATSWRETWKSRATYFILCAATWILLGALVIDSAGRGGTAGFGTAMPWWKHALMQCWAVPRYALLTLFPSDLIFDYGYGSNVLRCLNPVWVGTGAISLLIVVTLTIRSLRRYSAAGFVSLACLAVLSPSSSIVPILTEPIAEHRAYLPSLGVALAIGTLSFLGLGRRGLLILLLVVPAMALGTVARNRMYANQRLLWQDNVAKIPGSARGHDALGTLLAKDGQTEAGLAHIREALRIIPDYIDARANLGYTLAQSGRTQEGIVEMEAAVKLDPRRVATYINLGSVYHAAGQPESALAQFNRVLEFRPRHPEAHNNIAVIRLEQGNVEEAVRHLHIALAEHPSYADANYNLGNAASAQGNLPDAARFYRLALATDPEHVEALNNLGGVLIRSKDLPSAIEVLRKATKAKPDYVEARNSLGVALIQTGQFEAGIEEFSAALKVRPGYRDAENNLRFATAELNKRRSN